ncbi:MAG: DNA polymerase III subunit delta' [Deltaproteobacteria bacterium]|nr:DNA polymerase III subunit delta' [Deltaproteobacteria bacterium]
MIDAADLKFSGIIGHESAVGLLKRAMASSRVAHAYLFAGPDGVGKRRTAHAFAAAMLCAADGGEACGTCVSCRKLVDGNHPDYLEIGPDGRFIKIDAMREMIGATRFMPFESPWKIFVVLDAERMNEASANAFLKTLEEPTKSTLLILICSAPQQLLPTILSRCQKINFGPLPADNLARLVAERRELDPDRAALVARLADGSVGRALAIDEEYAFERRPALGRMVLGLAPGRDTDVLNTAREVVNWPEGPEDAFELVKSFLADAARLAAGLPEDALAHPDLADAARRFADHFSAPLLAHKTRTLSYAQRLLARNANKLLTAEAALMDAVTPRITDFAERMPK